MTRNRRILLTIVLATLGCALSVQRATACTTAEDYQPVYLRLTVDGKDAYDYVRNDGTCPFTVVAYVDGEERGSVNSFLHHIVVENGYRHDDAFMMLPVAFSPADAGKDVRYHVIDEERSITFLPAVSSVCGTASVGQPSSPLAIDIIRPTGITMDASVTLYEGIPTVLPYTLSPANATPVMPVCDYDTNVLEVDALAGTVTGLSITAADTPVSLTIHVGSMSATTAVTIVSAIPLEKLTLTQTSVAMASGASVTLKATPSPANASIDVRKLSVSFTDPLTLAEGWTWMESTTPAVADGSVAFTLTARCTGNGSVSLAYNDQTMATADVAVGLAVNFAEGWSWMSIPACDRLGTLQSISEVFGTAFVEARGSKGDIWLRDNARLYGTATSMQGRMVQLHLDGTDKMAQTSMILQNIAFPSNEVLLEDGWTMLFYPYEIAYTLQYLTEATDLVRYIEVGTTIHAQTAFAELTDDGWKGTLTTLEPGVGYLIHTDDWGYSIEWPAGSQLSQDGVYVETNEDDRNASPAIDLPVRRFADNMSLVAEDFGETAGSGNVVMAFVGDECRGIGHRIDGRWFITVHGTKGETVTFALCDATGSVVTPLPASMPFTDIAGSFRAPVNLTDDTAEETATAAPVFDLTGRRIDTPSARGIYITGGRKTLIR